MVGLNMRSRAPSGDNAKERSHGKSQHDSRDARLHPIDIAGFPDDPRTIGSSTARTRAGRSRPRTRGLRAGRCYLGCGAFLSCAALVFASTLSVPAVAKAVLLAMALASADLALAACWAVPIDIAPDHAGVMTGFMNTMGNLGGMIAPLVVPFAVERWASWSFAFYVTALVYASGGIAWLAIDPTESIIDEHS